MKQKILIPFILLLVFLGSCVEKPIEKDGLPTIALNKSQDILPISSFVENLDYLELKVSEVGKELGDIENIKELNGHLVIQQRRAREISFLSFNSKGDYINTLVSNKQGKGKIKRPLDIIDYKKGYAVLADDGIYLIGKDGEFKSKIVSAQMPGSRFFYDRNQFYVINEIPGNGTYSVFAEDEKVAKIEFPEPRLRELGKSNLVAADAKNIRLASAYSDTVFAYAHSGFKSLYHIASNEFPSFASIWRNINTNDAVKTLKHIHNTPHAKIKSYLENENFIFLTYWLGSHQTTAVINKTDWQTTYFAQAVNNIDGGIWDNPNYLSADNQLYIPITAYKVIGHRISDKRHQEFETIQQRITVSGNPLIMRCRLK
ncbi:6-bladed beta-propeller [uncultured Draconibacterium sp.]|uniref:6-bladed beta-propeller n=1 Tax=uncultured Draconibacterium sp. TaxID=1573823 RepID=UPI0032613D57